METKNKYYRSKAQFLTKHKILVEHPVLTMPLFPVVTHLN